MKLLTFPFNSGIGKAPDNLQLGLTDVQRDKEFRENFNCVKYAYFFALLYDSRSKNFKDAGKNTLSVFASTCKYERTFSLRSLNKLDFSARMT
jgi:hypothetical protein